MKPDHLNESNSSPEEILSQSLFERIGGKSAVEAAVDLFYDKVLADDRIKHFFTRINMMLQREKQKAFLTYAFGGSPNYSGKDMRKAHEPLVAMGMNETHFNAVMENLEETMKELGVSEDLISEAAAIAMSVKDEVLNR